MINTHPLAPTPAKKHLLIYGLAALLLTALVEVPPLLLSLLSKGIGLGLRVSNPRYVVVSGLCLLIFGLMAIGIPLLHKRPLLKVFATSMYLGGIVIVALTTEYIAINYTSQGIALINAELAVAWLSLVGFRRWNVYLGTLGVVVGITWLSNNMFGSDFLAAQFLYLLVGAILMTILIQPIRFLDNSASFRRTFIGSIAFGLAVPITFLVLPSQLHIWIILFALFAAAIYALHYASSLHSLKKDSINKNDRPAA